MEQSQRLRQGKVAYNKKQCIKYIKTIIPGNSWSRILQMEDNSDSGNWLGSQVPEADKKAVEIYENLFYKNTLIQLY